jgi:hypothetical protein
VDFKGREISPGTLKGRLVSPEAGVYLLRHRRLVVWLFPLRRADGEEFKAGTMFEVLRQDGDKLNLCEIDPCRPFKVGRTICTVSHSENYKLGECHAEI